MTDHPRWVLMWVLAGSIYGACKCITLVRLAHPFSQPGIWIYLFAWPGMNSPAFFQRTPPVLPRRIGISGIAFLVTGIAGICFAGQIQTPLLRGVLGMVGCVMMLHFGLFRLLADWWTVNGWNAPALMKAPLLTLSLSDFWGKRWNRAFRDLTHRFLFRPLTKLLNPAHALLSGFLVSGLVHELVITVPAGGGYGGPTVYFLIQGFGILGEKHLWPDSSPQFARILTVVCLFAPLPLLFPPLFIREVMAPFVTAIAPTP